MNRIYGHVSGGTEPTLCLWNCTSCPLASCLLFLTTDAKNYEVCVFKEDERACIRGLLSNWHTSLTFFVTYFFLSLQSTIFLVQILSYNFFLCGVNFANLWKPSSFMGECHALHFVEVSVDLQCFLPIRTNFVKNIEPQYLYLGKFCRDSCNYVKIRHLIA